MIPPTISGGELGLWCDDSVRRLTPNTSINPNVELGGNTVRGRSVLRPEALLAIAHFCQSLAKCEETFTDNTFVEACIRRRSILSEYLTLFSEYLMEPDASPFFAVEEKNITLIAVRDRMAQARKEAARLRGPRNDQARPRNNMHDCAKCSRPVRMGELQRQYVNILVLLCLFFRFPTPNFKKALISTEKINLYFEQNTMTQTVYISTADTTFRSPN